MTKYILILTSLLVNLQDAYAAKKSAIPQNTAQSQARCFLYGVTKNTIPGQKNTFGALQDFLRMNFDADTPKKCERMISAYCRQQLLGNKQDIQKLDAYFRRAGDKKPTIFYEIGKLCEISRTKESEEPMDE